MPTRSASSNVARLAAASLIAVLFMGSTVVTPLYAIYAKTFHFGEVELTLIYATYVVGNLAALLFFGRVSDQIGRRRAALAALAIAVVSTMTFLFATGPAWLFVGRALSGFAIGIAAGTGTAWLVETEGKEHASTATLLATTANLSGLAVGPLLAAWLADDAPAPLRLAYVVYLVLVAVAAALVLRAREPDVERSGELTFTPRIGVPSVLRARFASPAITGFCTFAFVGFYAALLPGLVGDRLGRTDHLVGGAIVFALFAVGAIVNVATRGWSSRGAMLAGLAAQVPALALLVAADRLASLPLLFTASGIGGVAVALGYRGSLSVINDIAPADAKAELASSYLIACFIGNALPVIGVALLSRARGDSVVAVTVFAVVVAALAILAAGLGLRARHEKADA